MVSMQRWKDFLDCSSHKFFYRSRSNVKMNVNVNVKMTNYWARPNSGRGASLTLNFSKIPVEFCDECLYISVALNGFQVVVEGFLDCSSQKFFSITIQCENERETTN